MARACCQVEWAASGLLAAWWVSPCHAIDPYRHTDRIGAARRGGISAFDRGALAAMGTIGTALSWPAKDCRTRV